MVYTAVDAQGAEAQGDVRIDFIAAVADRYQVTRGPSASRWRLRRACSRTMSAAMASRGN
jgi:hypothetical protein